MTSVIKQSVKSSRFHCRWRFSTTRVSARPPDRNRRPRNAVALSESSWIANSRSQIPRRVIRPRSVAISMMTIAESRNIRPASLIKLIRSQNRAQDTPEFPNTTAMQQFCPRNVSNLLHGRPLHRASLRRGFDRMLTEFCSGLHSEP
jgi:hypothetical protein